jgi:hypothetical protein
MAATDPVSPAEASEARLPVAFRGEVSYGKACPPDWALTEVYTR